MIHRIRWSALGLAPGDVMTNAASRAGYLPVNRQTACRKGGNTMTVQHHHPRPTDADETSGLVLVLAILAIAAALVLALT